MVPTNYDIAADLAIAGFHVFPCMPTKRPHRIAWRSASTTDQQAIAAWWRRWPDALPGVDLGKSNLIVIDADRHGGPDGVAAWSALCSEYGFEPAAWVSTPSNGLHFYFRNLAEPLGNREGALPKGINVRGNGGYVIGPGAMLPDGRVYQLEGNISNPAELPGWLADLIRAEKADKKAAAIEAPAPRPIVKADINEDRLRAYTESAIEEELARVRSAGKGVRNNTLNEAAFALGTMVGAGWIGETAAGEWLLAAALDAGLTRPESLATIRSGLRSGIAKPRSVPEDRGGEGSALGAEIAARMLAARPCARADDGTLYDTETGEVLAAPAPAVKGAGDADWHYPGGLLGEITQWILDTTPRRPNRPLALGAAIVTIGTIIGRTLATPTRSGTHLFIACIGNTGIGKDWPQRAIGELLGACKLGMCATSGKWKSDVALEAAIADAPAQVAVIDEIGQQLFANIMGRRAGTHTAGIGVALRELWSASFGKYQTSASAQRRAVTIQAPAFSIYGASTIEEFYESLTGGAMDNGFFNRWLVIRAAPRAKARRKVAPQPNVPGSLVASLQSLLLPGAGNLDGGARALTQGNAPDCTVMPWASTAVADAYEAFDEGLIDRADQEPAAAQFLGRTAEMSLRLATIHAASRAGRGAALTDDDLTWGQAVAMASAELMIRDVRDRMADNEFQARHKLVERLIREAGGVIRRRDLMRHINGKVPGAEVDRILGALAEAEVVTKLEEKPAGGGRPLVSYLYRKE